MAHRRDGLGVNLRRGIQAATGARSGERKKAGFILQILINTSHRMNKPRLSFWQIWNMSFGFIGIQFGWGLQMANMSPIYKYLGASDAQIPMLWLAAPLTGFIVQPIIGAMSDRTWGPLGRRRPYFLVGAVLSSLALVFM